MSSKTYFDQVANQWDSMRQDFFSEVVREKAYEAAGIEEGRIAGDIGAGTGFITEGLVQRGLKVIAVDQSQEMLDRMKAKYSCFNSIEYRTGESENLPIKDNSLDYTFANMYIHHVESPKAAIAEMARVLKPGGKLVVTDLDEHSHEFLRLEQFDRWMGFKRVDVKKWFLDAGLKDVVVDCVGGNCCATSGCGSESASISIFIAYGIK